ncbi:uncharacterized protein LOC131597455 [Vicia villosa]|uniref:uncharacterized protein LOC131597455 n=1 Tax=Vicia villosa TaxID=3911 RepID=UPI00273BAFB2|nr:uncharacterized protein LOC131597455 [Vicia villosa]
MKDLRPISLCNVVYKLVAKMLANRLKLVLYKCVSEEQLAFVEGRSIIDNALGSTEIIHALKRKTSGNTAHLALKIDISKAYDRVDWGFLRAILLRLGFDERWIHWLMMCVTSVHYSVLVNSDRVGPIIPGRGLRQGDPLSPYLFILVSEGLSALIKGAVSRGDLHGAHICRRAPSVANLVEVTNLMNILNTYTEATGQEINLAKSEVFFSRKLSGPAQEDLARLMGVKHVMGTGMYLGLPSMIGRSKKAVFSFIKDRIWKRINTWSGRSLSRAGKEVMIKSVLQSIPAYIMSVYLIPDGVVNDIERMLNSFWWGGGRNNKGIRWLAWDRMTSSKSEGGMGFRDFKAFNMAMVAKQGWNIVSKPDTLVARIFKARYFPNSSYLDSKIGNNPSYAWRNLWKAKEVLRIGSQWSIGSGSSIKVMYDPWIREKDGWWANGPQCQNVYNLFVKDLMLPTIKQWDVIKVKQLFDNEGAEAILRVPLVEDVVNDRLIWHEEENGEYSVKSGYKLWKGWLSSTRQHGMESRWKNIWSITAPPRAKHLLWRICNGCLPTRLKLQQHHVQCPSVCPWCEVDVEDECREDRRDAGRFAVLLEVLWRSRNNVVSVVCMVLQIKGGVLGITWGDLFQQVCPGMRGFFSVIEAETIALKEAIQNTIFLHLSHVIFESDYQLIIKSIHDSKVGSSEFSVIINSIRQLLALFPNFEVKFIRRQANLVAHALAKAANSWARRSFINSVPPCIEPYLLNDIS